MRTNDHHTTTTLDWAYYEAKVKTMSDPELLYARADAFKAAQALRGTEGEGLYMDELSVYAREQKARREAS